MRRYNVYSMGGGGELEWILATYEGASPSDAILKGHAAGYLKAGMHYLAIPVTDSGTAKHPTGAASLFKLDVPEPNVQAVAVGPIR